MAIITRVGHAALRAALVPGHRRFLDGCTDLERTQRGMLARLLRQVSGVDARIDARWRWEDYVLRQPVTGWQDWSPYVERQRRTHERYLVDSPVLRYQPTSGSTSAIKWIPYTQQFLGELDAAIAPWLADLYATHPGVRRGHHYWSLSWLPTAMRDAQRGDLNDDMTLLSAGKRGLARLTQAVPQDASLATTSDGSLFVTLAHLAADAELSALSVWSPSFALNLLERLGAWREELASALACGRWPTLADGALHLPCPRAPRAAAMLREWDARSDPAFFTQLWPRLALVSAWDTAAAAPWAARLRALLPHAAFQGKGLWATEGVVTIPYRGAPVLAYRSHVYEFENLDDGRVLAPWQLRQGQRVSPLLSTGSGLLRYRMNDIVEVDGFLGSVPRLRFLGRNDGTDLVGEKLGTLAVQQALDTLGTGDGLVPVTLLAVEDSGCGRPGYLLLLEADRVDDAVNAQASRIGDALERQLCGHFHYRLARDLGQLSRLRVSCLPAMRARYAAQCRALGMIEGNIKIEPLRAWRGRVPPSLYRDTVPREETPAIAGLPA